MYGLGIGLSNFNALRLVNIRNETNSLEFIRNLCILFLNEKDSNGKFSEFSNAYELYNKLVPKLVHNSVQDNSQTQLNTNIYNTLKSIIDLNEDTYNLSNSISLSKKMKDELDLIQIAAEKAAAEKAAAEKAAADKAAAEKAAADKAAAEKAAADKAAAAIPVTSSAIPDTSSVVIPATSSAPIPATSSVPIPDTSSAAIPDTSSVVIPATSSVVIPATTATINPILVLILSNNSKIISNITSILSVFPTDPNTNINKQSILDNLSLVSKYLQTNKLDNQIILDLLIGSIIPTLYNNLKSLINPLIDQYKQLINNTFIDYKIKLYNILLEINNPMNPTSDINQMLTVVNIDKPYFGTVFFSGTNVDYKDPTIDKDDKENTNIYDKNDFIASLSTLSENLKDYTYSTSGNYLLPNGFIGNCRLNYGGIIKFGTFALVNSILDNTNKPMSSIDLSQKFGMIFMAYNPCSESLSLPQFYN